MASQSSFACAHAWWSWHHPKIIRAVAGAAHEHLLARVRRALGENKAAGRLPDSFDALNQRVLVRRDPRNFDRAMSGRHASSDGFRLALATALNVPVAELFPDNRSWIQRAVCRLCNGAISERDAEAYARFRMTNGNGSSCNGIEPESNNDAIDTQAMAKVIATLETELRIIDQEMQSNGR